MKIIIVIIFSLLIASSNVYCQEQSMTKFSIAFADKYNKRCFVFYHKSDLVTKECDNKIQNIIKSICPNPVISNTSLLIETELQTDCTISVSGTLGVLNQVWKGKLNLGTNEIQIDMKELNIGTYTLVVKTDYNTFYKQFMKQ
jgi:hypothetical protein